MSPERPPAPSGAHVLVLGLTGAYTPLAAYVRPFARRNCAVTWVTARAGAAALERSGCDVLPYDGNVPSDGDLAGASHDGDVAALLAELDRRHAVRPIRAVVSYVEEWVPAAARLALRYGVPHANGPDAARLTTDKYAMRCALAAAGLPVPRYHLVRTAADAVRAALDVGLPCVVKPRRSSASRGVRVVRRLEDVPAVFAWTAQVAGAAGGEGAVLVEGYLGGSEYSAEVVVARGEPVFIGFTEKHLVGGAFCDEVGHLHPHAFPPEVDAAARAAVAGAVRATSVRAGGCHVEFKYDPAAEHPVTVIEIASRPGGDAIPELVRMSTGVDFLDLAGGAALGEVPAPVSEAPRGGARQYAAVRFVAATRDAVVVSTDVARDVYARPGVLKARLLAPLGRSVRPRVSGTERIGYVVGRHADPRLLVDSLAGAARDLADRALASRDDLLDDKGTVSPAFVGAQSRTPSDGARATGLEPLTSPRTPDAC
jgi:cysteine synthase A